MAGFLSTEELDFETYRDALKEYLRGQDVFKDYDFDGSNMSVLIDLLARNTYHNAYYLNMIGSEAFLDSAQLRESVVSRSKELNYVPRSRVSSAANVNIQILATGNTNLITIPKYYTISAVSNEGAFIFSTDEQIVVRADAGLYFANNVTVYEGRVVSEYFVANTNSRYVVSSANVDITSLEVNVTNSVTDTANSNWTKASNLYGLDGRSEVFFVQGSQGDKYEVVFGNGVTGKAIQGGNVIKLTYRDTTGPDADGLTRFQPVSKIDGFDVVVTLADTVGSYGGAERETIPSIKFNAPRHFATQDRAITKGDYIALIRNRFPQVEKIAVFGGEELEEKRYGKVVIAIKPYGAQAAPDALKNLIQAYISNRTSVAIDPIFVDPDYFYVAVDTKVYIDAQATSKSISGMKSVVLNAVSNYSKTNLTDFASDLRTSRLTAAIDNADSAIVSNDTAIKIIKRISPKKKQAESFVIEYKAPFKVSLDKTTITSSRFFFYNASNNTTYTAYIRDDGKGKLGIYTSDSLGRETRLRDDLGTVDYTKGKLFLNNLYVDDYAGYIAIYAEMVYKDFAIQQNQILTIDPDDVVVTIEKASF